MSGMAAGTRSCFLAKSLRKMVQDRLVDLVHNDDSIAMDVHA